MRAGYVALVGRPNVGKSTLLNALAGEEVSITTPKPETTRDRILAVLTRPDAQLVLLDTPGVHRAHGALGEHMNREARDAANDADVVVLVVDATEGALGPAREAEVLEALGSVTKPVILAVNKVDRLRPRNLVIPVLDAYAKVRAFDALVPVSASTKDNLGPLFDEIVSRLPEGPALFPEDTLTDRPERFLVAERIREAVIHETGEEIPYVTAVTIDRFDEKNPVLHLQATVHVERAGQKKIVVGSGGERVRAIGTRARVAIEKLLGRKVYLELWVKVSAEWTRSHESLARFGYTSPKKRKGDGRDGGKGDKSAADRSAADKSAADKSAADKSAAENSPGEPLAGA